MEKEIKHSIKILKNNYSFYRDTNIQKKDKQRYREFMIGIYNRFDELGLLYSKLKDISFKEAIKELGIEYHMGELNQITNPKGSQ